MARPSLATATVKSTPTTKRKFDVVKSPKKVESGGNSDLVEKVAAAKLAWQEARKELLASKKGPRAQFRAQTIKVLTKENPYRDGTGAHARFELLNDGMTVGEYTAAGGISTEVHKAVKAGHIELVEE